MDKLYPEEARQERLNENIELLNQSFADGLIPLEQYLDAIDRLYDEENQDYWDRWLEGLRKAAEDFTELASNVVDDFTSSFGDAVGKIVTQGASLRDTFANLAQSMAQSIISALVKMGAQWLVYQ